MRLLHFRVAHEDFIDNFNKYQKIKLIKIFKGDWTEGILNRNQPGVLTPTDKSPG